MNISRLYSTIDTQVLGEAFRVVIQSPISFSEGSLKEKQLQLYENFNKEKQLLLNEPRGHRGINGCVILPSLTASYELLFFNHPGSAAFKIEGIAASLTALLETGNILQNENNAYHVLTAYGDYVLQADFNDQQVTSIEMKTAKGAVTLQNKEASIYSVDERQYVVEPLPNHINSIDLDNLQALEQWGNSEIKTIEQHTESLNGLLVVEKVRSNHYKTVTFEKDGYIRRTPGIDCSNVLIQAFATELDNTEPVKNETIFGSILTANQHDYADITEYQIRPFITASQEFVLDPEDPLPTGFLIK